MPAVRCGRLKPTQGASPMTVKITSNGKGAPEGKLADAELHFTAGPLEGLKLIGFGIWERRGGARRNVTLPARQDAVDGGRPPFSPLPPPRRPPPPGGPPAPGPPAGPAARPEGPP